MIDYSGFRQTGGPGTPFQNPRPLQQQPMGQLPYMAPSPTIRPFNLSATGGGGPARQRPPWMQYSQPGASGIPMPMGMRQGPLGSPIQMGGPDPTVNGPYQMGTPQYPVGNRTGMPQWMTQNPIQMGIPQYPDPNSPSGWRTNPVQMGIPQWPGMQLRQPMRQQQSPWGMPGRY